MLCGLAIALVGGFISSANEEGELGGPVVMAGVVFMLVGGAAYLITQIRKAVESERR